MTQPPDLPQHYQPEYLAGEIRSLTIAQLARVAGVASEFDDQLSKLQSHAENDLKGRKNSVDYYKGWLHAAGQIRGELF